MNTKRQVSGLSLFILCALSLLLGLLVDNCRQNRKVPGDDQDDVQDTMTTNTVTNTVPKEVQP